jgi:hypothetical protein
MEIEVRNENANLGSQSEEVKTGLSLPEMDHPKVKALKHAIDTGLNSESVEYTYESFMAELEQEECLIWSTDDRKLSGFCTKGNGELRGYGYL